MADKMISRELFEKVYGLCRSYDPFTFAIDNGRQKDNADRANSRIREKLSALGEENGYEMKYVPYGVDCSNYEKDARAALEKWFNDKGFEVEPAPPKKVWTAEQINYIVQTNDEQLYKALDRLYIRDLFNKEDKDFLISIVRYLIKTQQLTAKQRASVRKLMPKYTDKLVEIVNS